MSKEISKQDSFLFDRIVSILDQARGNVVRSVNYNMVLAYWLIGREIVEGVLEGEERSQYGKNAIEKLSLLLNKRYQRGFSTPNLKLFRQLYLTYRNRIILDVEDKDNKINNLAINQSSANLLLSTLLKRYPGSELGKGFNPDLSWSHYRALMRVKNEEARNFYEKEAAECQWSKSQLERQIQTSYYERIVSNKGEQGLLPVNRERLRGEEISQIHLLKSPYVLEFLDLPDSPKLHESDLEQAIIKNLQSFLLELGKGFSFVARQKHIRVDDDDFYIDLVFYNYFLKCFVLIDLKVGKLNHSAVGQMDGYVRIFEDKFKAEGDNPTIGLILCSDKSETVAKYSILNESKQIFASKYLQYLPTEKELQEELRRERLLIEENIEIEKEE